MRSANQQGGEAAERRQAAEAPLRADVHALGELLGSTLRAQHGEAFFQRLEQVRQLARRRRSEVPAGSTSGSKAERDAARPSDGGQLETLLEGLPLHEKQLLVRAFSTFLFLANIAENHHRVRRRWEAP